MSLIIGDLVGLIHADDSGMRRGLTAAELRMRGFQTDTNGRLRDLRGRFVAESQVMGEALADAVEDATEAASEALENFTRDAAGRLRDTRGRFVAEGAAMGEGLADGIQAGGEDGMTGLRGIFSRHMRALRRDMDTESRSMWSRFTGLSSEAGEGAGRGMAGRMLAGIASTVRSGIGAAFQAGMSGLSSVVSGLASNPQVAMIGVALAKTVVVVASPLIASLLSTAVISVAGIGIIGLGWALLKTEPEVKKAAKQLTKTIKSTFEEAAEPMIQPFKTALGSLKQTVIDLGPQINQAFETVAESGAIKSLTDGIDQLVKNAMPGFLQMLEDTGPIFEGIEELMSDVGEGLSGFFAGIAGSGPDAKVALEDVGNAIRFMLIAAGETIGFLARLYSNLREGVVWIVDRFRWLYDVLVGHSIIPDLINAIVMWFGRLPGRAFNALANFGPMIVSRAQEAGSRMGAAIRTKIAEFIAYVAQIPSRARSALGGLGSTLFQAGVNLIRGFINGFKSMFGSVRSHLNGLTASLPDWKGPEATDERILTPAGRLLIKGLQAGISDQTPFLRGQLRSLTGALPSMALDMGVAGMGLPGAPGAAMTGAAGPAASEVHVRVSFDASGAPALEGAVLQSLRATVSRGGGDVQKVIGNDR